MKKILMTMIRFYQKNISPATPPSCRYHPTCSSYALEAIDKHGAVKGGVMSTARILRCNPFVEGGVDHVPDYFTVRRNPANIDELHLPASLFALDAEMKSEINDLLEKHQDKLIINDQLPNAFEIVNGLVDLKEISPKDLEKEFTTEEIAYLKDIYVLPSLKTKNEDYRYFTLTGQAKDTKYLETIRSFDVGIELGKNHPLIIMEKTGLWYTNLPQLMNDFLITRGVTKDDLNSPTYHLWLVLKAIDQSTHSSAE